MPVNQKIKWAPPALIPLNEVKAYGNCASGSTPGGAGDGQGCAGGSSANTDCSGGGNNVYGCRGGGAAQSPPCSSGANPSQPVPCLGGGGQQ